MNVYKPSLMENSINYFSRTEFYLGAETLPDLFLACWHRLGINFPATSWMLWDGKMIGNIRSIHTHEALVLGLFGVCTGRGYAGRAQRQAQLHVLWIPHQLGVQRKHSENIAVFVILPYPNVVCTSTPFLVFKKLVHLKILRKL